MIIYFHIIGSIFETKLSSIINGFFIWLIVLSFIVLSYYIRIINFEVFSILVILFSISLLIIALSRYKLLINKFNTYHVLAVSIIWIIIYLMNSSFSIITANGFDDYHYIGIQKIIINKIQISPHYTEHAANIVEGWIYISAAISKVLHLDPVQFNKISMSIVNIFITTSIVESTSFIFRRKTTPYSVYALLLLLLFPIFSFEFWSGSISRLIYRPFYGSSLSVIGTNLIILYLCKEFFKVNVNKKLLILIIFLAIIINIHINNILLIIFYLGFIYTYNWNKYLPYLVIIIFWIITNLFFNKYLFSSTSKSTHEYWNVMYDVTRYPFVISYLSGIGIMFIKKKRTEIDFLTIIFIPIVIMYIFFSNTKILLFNFIYGFGLQRFISQVLVILFVYVITNLFSSEDKNIKKIFKIILFISIILNYQHTSLYSGFLQNQKNILTRSDKESINIDKIIGKNKNVLTQNWVSIKPDKVDFSSYYSYIGTNSCSYNMFSNLKASTNSNAYYYISDFSNLNKVKKAIDKYNVDQVIISEKYRNPNALLCEEKLDVLWNKMAINIIKNATNLSIEKTRYNNVNKWLKKISKSRQVYKLKTRKSLFGKIYIYNLKKKI